MKDKKKTPRADLEDKKGIFLQFGIIIALLLVFFAFEKKFYENEIQEFDRIVDDIYEEDVKITKPEEPEPPKETPPETDILQIVDDETELEEEFTIDAESDEETEVEFVPVIEEDEEAEEQEIFQVVEEMPEFPGGLGKLKVYLGKTIKYPEQAKELGIKGKVYVAFVVEPNGSISNVSVKRGIGGGCDEEAVRVIKRMPKWNPGKQRGKAVRVQFLIPVVYTLL